MPRTLNRLELVRDFGATITSDEELLPSQGSAPVKTRRQRVVPFGDGYSQTLPDGLNWISTQYEVSWELRDYDLLDPIDRFLDEVGTDFFFWTPPLKTVPMKWRVVENRGVVVEEGERLGSLSATFVEVFDVAN